VFVGGLRGYPMSAIAMSVTEPARGLEARPVRILVAEDHEVMRMGIRNLLESNPDWKVYAEAKTGREAVALALESSPDVIIMDITMPEMNGLMQKAMSGVSVPFVTALLDGYDGFGGVQRLVDVGGSAGDCLRMILRKHPHVREGINFDLPEVVAKAPQIPRVTHVGGNMFEAIPAADAIFMKWILTTWTDDEVKLIMENCYKALPVGGKMIVCEPVLPEKTDESHRTRALLEGDIFVMTIYRAKGKHRTEEEYRQLGHSAGFPHIQAFYIDYVFTVLEFRK